ncbi:acyltransferase family protein [Caenimonas aquaedulcis]|uniref:Acyltransferase n=1 Tax=Caenimonas aquaedulcis TaxID=2793270 RepID=A0A931H7A5_9BURK|nr:acyltransferase [Caenimonas aquaedulcis]MBG9389772.1 acyltransferase [Caenimonas aquaedulcis]
MMQPSRHLNNFDFIRLCAALFVLLSHQFALTGLPEPVILDVHSLGGFGVLIFFSVSGYLVAGSWDSDPHLGRFAARRLLRIWPGLAVAVALTVFIWGPLVSPLPWRDYFRHPGVVSYLKNAIFLVRDGLPVFFTGNALPTSVSGPLWTIPLEIKCYVVLALLGAVAGRRMRWLLLVVTLAALARYAVVEPRGDFLMARLGWPLEQRFLLEFGFFFSAGVLIQAFGILNSGKLKMILLLALGAAVACALAQLSFLAIWLALPLAVLAFGVSSTPVVRRAGRFGDLSYGIYIYAFPIQQTLIWRFGQAHAWTTVLAITVILTVAMAWLSWRFVERPALRMKPRTVSEVNPPHHLLHGDRLG